MNPLAATYYDATTKTWSGPKRTDLYSEQATLGEVIYDSLSKSPDKVIQIHDQTGEKLKAGELLDYADALSRNLWKMGLRPGDVIGLYAGNWTHVSTLMLASFLSGMPVNALYPGFDKDSAALIFKVTRPKIIFCDQDNFENAAQFNEELQLNVPIYLMNGHREGVPRIVDLLQRQNVMDEEGYRYPCIDLKGDDTAMILCSSGTTGIPKGVKCSNRALLNQIIFVTIKYDSVTFTYSTMYWASGLWTLIASLVNVTLRIVTNAAYTPESFLDLVRRYRVTHMVLGGPQMAELSSYSDVGRLQECLESVDSMLVGGSKVPLIVQEKMIAFMSNNVRRPGFSVSYGMSELAGMLTTNSGHPMEQLVGSEGKLVANKQVRIISKEGQALGPQEHGEICIHTPYTWFGYYNNAEATAKALRNGWLYTGDIGFFDEEGFLHVCARDNDVFKSRNFQIYPQLIEEVILRLPGVREVCVVGVPDFVASNLVACALVPTESEEGQQLTVKEVHQHVKANMGSIYHLSGGVFFVDAIPKTGSGKPQRAKAQEIVVQMWEKEGNKTK